MDIVDVVFGKFLVHFDTCQVWTVVGPGGDIPFRGKWQPLAGERGGPAESPGYGKNHGCVVQAGRPKQAKKIKKFAISNQITEHVWSGHIMLFAFAFFFFRQQQLQARACGRLGLPECGCSSGLRLGHINGTQKASSWLALRSKVDGWLLSGLLRLLQRVLWDV